MTSSASPTNESLASGEEPIDSKKLLPHEFWWRDHQPWLAEKGYMLRPRYSPDWEPSWKDHQFSWFFEDGKFTIYPQVMDATRISDDALVGLKRFSRKVHPHETAIGLYFSSEPLASHPRNRCAPIYDVFDIPDTDGEAIMVMPLLREFWDPRMKSVGEAVEFFRQIFEARLLSSPTRALDLTFAQGLQFMHQCHVAHRSVISIPDASVYQPLNTRFSVAETVKDPTL
ncbi:hypothetical protein NLI96_g7315 [Meripilus lineatus]|uniref:Protein kinase domain-containing protein n=1 Tax=Meripilus lineatus TaxID=2056292 RepID=A0AAD5V143_9APHY|nr:hypothetical protein NLI96_g7315 [Physisporinus lineatus]